jgi:hypothetical protein
MSWETTAGLVPIEAEHGVGQIDRAKTRFIGERDAQTRRPRLAAACLAFLTAFGKPLFKSVLSGEVTGVFLRGEV